MTETAKRDICPHVGRDQDTFKEKDEKEATEPWRSTTTLSGEAAAPATGTARSVGQTHVSGDVFKRTSQCVTMGENCLA